MYTLIHCEHDRVLLTSSIKTIFHLYGAFSNKSRMKQMRTFYKEHGLFLLLLKSTNFH